MDVKILDNSFYPLGIVDTYTYLRYTENFYDSGELELRLPFDVGLWELLKPPSRLFVEDTVYTVKRVKCVNDEIYVHALGLFEDFRDIYTDNYLYTQISPTTLISSLASKASFDSVNYKVYTINSTDYAIEEYDAYTSCYDVIRRVARENKIGFRFSYEPSTRELAFRIMSVTDRATPQIKELCVISDRRDSFSSLEADYDISNYKNIAEVICGYDSEGDTVSYTLNRCELGDTERKIVVFPTNLIYTDEQQRELALRAYAQKLLFQRSKKRSFKVELLCDPHAKIGDLCYFESTELGEQHYCLVEAREVRFIDTCRIDTLVLEVE